MSRPVTQLAIFETREAVRETLRTIFDLAGDFNCLGAWADIYKAGAMAKWSQADIVLLDIDAGAGHAIDEIRRQAPQARIVLLTVYEEIDKLFACLQKGACGYLLKRSRREDIVASIREAHIGGALMTSATGRRLMQFFREHSSAPSAMQLSEDESGVLHMVSGGLRNEEIAQRLEISIAEVRRCQQRVYAKLHRITNPASSADIKDAVSAHPQRDRALDLKPHI